MYKPPENTNRVKAMKSKFENNEKVTLVPVKTNLTKVPITLERQLSDPVKVSIKRTPAFRNDKVVQRSSMQASGRSKSSENKSLNSKICDKITPEKSADAPLNSATNFNVLRKRFDSQENLKQISPERALKERSNTSAEIILNRERINKMNTVKFPSEEKPNNKNEVEYENISALYTEPIPKSQRPKPGNIKTIHNTSTLKLGDKINSPKLVSETINNCIKNSSTNSGHKKCHDDINQKLNALTDTLKIALKKPLPAGPAPKKPPRTFQHSPIKVSQNFENELNKSLQKNINMHTKPPRNDPKYMLDKLEYALKNNRIRLKRDVKMDYTSEEDNCDNEIGPQKIKNETKCNLNCLQSLSCSNATYDSVEKPTFFINNVNDKKEEPVYAEPFVFPKTDSTDNKKNNRNSLYYMSTPVTSNMNNSLEICSNDEQTFPVDPGDSSSISTPTTSDMDSITSTPSEENKTFPAPKIKDLIKSFEPKKGNNIETRVDQLGKHLRRTLDTSFIADENMNDSSSDKGSLDGESTEQRVEQYETYVRTVRTKINSKLNRKQDASHLFHCCLLVGLNGKEPYVKFHFPNNVVLPLKVEELCFPDALDSKIDCSPKAQNYTIVVTNVNGKRMYGYCRRVLPENSNTCLPLAYCILSNQRAPRFYKMILKEIESRHGLPDKMRDVLLNEFYYKRFPSPGESIRANLSEINKYTSDAVLNDDNRSVDNTKNLDLSSFTYVTHDGGYGTLNRKSSLNSSNKRNGVLFQNGVIPKDLIDDYNDNLVSLASPNEVIVTLYQDSRYKETDIQELCDTLDQDILLQIFASLLLERKVIFISCRLGKLSTCIEAIENMIHPFSWQHTLIAVVPKSLWEIVEAPTPLICGVLSVTVVNLHSITDGIVIDLDEGAILKSVQDEKTILPKVLRNEFKSAIALAYDTKPKSKASNVLLSDAFLRIFIRSCGHYKAFIKNGKFQKNEFIDYPKSKNIKAFLKWFTETSMFHNFIENALIDLNSFNNFDKRIEIYSSQETTSILEKMKDWKKDRGNTFF